MAVRIFPGLLAALLLTILPAQSLAQGEGGADPVGGATPVLPDGPSETVAPDLDTTGIAGDEGSSLLAREYDLTRRANPTPADPATYHLRRGDMLNVFVLTGEPENIELRAMVADDGNLTLPWVAPVQVMGMTLAEASQAVQTAYGEIYRRAFAQVALVKLGSFQIQLTGYVRWPGLYRVYNGTTLYGLLILLNIDTDGQRRLLNLMRLAEPAPSHTMPDLSAESMRTLGDFDPFDFSVRGKFDQDVLLEPWDRLDVTEPEVVIMLDRGVARPGRYAVKDGEGLMDIVALAGELERTVDLQNATVTRFDENGAPQISYFDLSAAIAAGEKVEVQNRDRYYLPSYSRHVYVLGEVNSPGAYAMFPGEGLLELIGRAGGFTPVAHTKFISVVRPPRLYQDRTEVESQVQLVDLRAYTKSGSEREKYSVIAGDIVFVPDEGNRLLVGDLFRGALSAFGAVLP